MESYQSVHDGVQNWVQLGSTGIFSAPEWNDFESPWNRENGRGVAEEELLELGGCKSTVLNLAGLYDDEVRRPRNWVRRVAKSKVSCFFIFLGLSMVWMVGTEALAIWRHKSSGF